MGEVICGLQAKDRFEGLLLGEPFPEAASSPLGEVLLVNGAGVELGSEEGFDLGKVVEPREDSFGLLIVAKAAVDFVAERVREAGNFAVAG